MGNSGRGTRTGHAQSRYSNPNSTIGAYSGSGSGRQEHSKPDAVGGLEEIVESVAKKAIYTVLPPNIQTAIVVTQKLYEHRKTIINTIESIVETWSSNADTETKVAETIFAIGKGGYNIAKKEARSALIAGASRTIIDFADADDNIKQLDKELSERGVPIDMRDFLEDALSKEIDKIVPEVKP